MEVLLLIIFTVLGLGLLIFEIIAYWKTYQKAGRPGWASIVPFYNGWVLAEIGDKPGWWGLIATFVYGGNRFYNENSESGGVAFISTVIFIVSLVIYVTICMGVAKNFKKSNGFAVLMVILPFIAFPILGYGQAKYKSAKK